MWPDLALVLPGQTLCFQQPRFNKFIVYQRIPNDQGGIDEQIYISTPKLDEKLMKYMQDMEMHGMKDSQ